MDAARIQAKIWKGNGKAAARLGYVFDVFRPTDNNDPCAPANRVRGINASFTKHGASNYNFGSPSDHKNPLFHVLCDGTDLRIGDYMVGDEGTFCLLSKQPIAPMLAVQTSRTVTFSRRNRVTTEGVLGYGAEQTKAVASGVAADQTLAANWPVSILKNSRGMRDDILPGDVGMGTFELIGPTIPGVVLRTSDIVTDDNNVRYIIQIAELTDLGNRALLYQAVT